MATTGTRPNSASIARAPSRHCRIRCSESDGLVRRPIVTIMTNSAAFSTRIATTVMSILDRPIWRGLGRFLSGT